MKNLLANNSANITSVVEAVRQTTGDARVDFNYLLEKFAEAFIYSNPADGAAFNQTVNRTVNGTPYTFTGFDIWDFYFTNYPYGYNWQGPALYPLANKPALQPYSVYVQSAADWTTSIKSSVTLNRPASSSVKLFLLMR